MRNFANKRRLQLFYYRKINHKEREVIDWGGCARRIFETKNKESFLLATLPRRD